MKKNNYETNALPARSRAIKYSRNRKMQNTPHNEIRISSVCDVLNNISKQVFLKCLCCGVSMLLHGNHFLTNGR